MTGSMRQEIIALLRGGPMSAKAISQTLAIREREVYDHLPHIKRSLAASKEERLLVEPSRCRECGYVFRKRERVTAPSRCPVCRSEHITEPSFEVRPR